MSTKNFFRLAALLFIVLFTSCSTDDRLEELSPSNESVSKTPAGVSPSEAVLRAFDIKYPNAKKVEWSIESGYYLANFTEQSSPIKAWFDNKGNWELSQVTISYNSLSQSARKSLVESAYADYSVLSANILERVNTADIYMVKITNDNQNLNVYVSYSGEIIRTKNSTASELETPVVIPAAVNYTMDVMFDSFEVLDYWGDSFGTKAGIMENNMYKLLSFDEAYELIATFWQVEEAEVPVNVLNKFAYSSYGKSTVEEIRIMDNGQKISYLFYFTQDGKNKIVSVDESASYITILTY